MTNNQLYKKISLLPTDFKKQPFVAELNEKLAVNNKITERSFGYAKDFFKVADDFDEPLADFQAYM